MNPEAESWERCSGTYSYCIESAVVWKQQTDKDFTAFTFQLKKSNIWNLTLK